MAACTEEDHRLWVSLSALGDGNVFAVLPQLVKQMLAEDVANQDDDFADVILPSDNTWQNKIYYKLVERQRMADARNKDENMLEPFREENTKLHIWNTIPKSKLVFCKSVAAKDSFDHFKGPAITWTVSDIAKAGCLLSSPPISTNFEDEQEMRRVYTLIYDVFRYRNVLMQALDDVCFFQIFSQLRATIPHVWLLFYDLYHRSFKKRETKVIPTATKLFDAYGLTFAENALWSQRVKLAAAVARLRIKHNALTLGELLPAHLKDERVTEQAKKNPVTCWVNSLKVTDVESFCQQITDTFDLTMVNDTKYLGSNNFKWDRHCPRIIAFHATLRPTLAKSEFVKNHLLIVQDRSFCLGPATFGKMIENLELTGSVIQTHVNSPRTTAYLATLLSQNDKIKKLMAFSAGKRKAEYESYFHELGMNNIVIFSDRLIDTPPDANYMEEVVAVFATPPNSYSAVVDPIDLVCSRGGDLSMLEVLTESGDTKQARERVARVLDEQKRTLRFAMSRPQIQFVLYETHSELEAENDFMVQRALKEINRIAKLQHATLQGKIQSDSSQESITKEINNNEKEMVEGETPKIETPSERNEDASENNEKILESLKIPDTDIFQICPLPKLCESENCDNFQKVGCYLALIQRKEVIRLDDKYMIQMAEHRGLFGSNTTAATLKSKSSRASKKIKQEKEEKPQRPKKRLKETEMDRIAAPTHTFLRHIKDANEIETCKKLDIEEDKRSVYKIWWKETTRHIVNLKRSLSRQKILTNTKIKRLDVKAVVDSFWHNVQRVDEIAKNSTVDGRIPVFPKLRLTRNNVGEKVYIPLAITNVNTDILPTLEEVDENSQSLMKDFGTITLFADPKNFLGKFTSAHIRQLVSPYYRQHATPLISNKPSTQSKVNKTSSREWPSKGNRPSSKGGSCSRKKKRIKNIVERLTIPTQNSFIKGVWNKTSKKEVKRPLKDYTNRINRCSACKNFENNQK